MSHSFIQQPIYWMPTVSQNSFSELLFRGLVYNPGAQAAHRLTGKIDKQTVL